jgi:hypothetical protein
MEVRFADGQVEQYEDKDSFFGAQASLYRSKDGKSLVKLYTLDDARPRQEQEQEHIKRVDKLIHELNPAKDDPYWSTFFTWPEKRVVSPQVGFRMRYVGGMRTMENYFLVKPFKRLPLEERGWFVGRIASAIKLASAANRLSAMGLCCSDFSGKNVLVDPFAGAAVLIDCDSLTIPGGDLSAVVDGTPEFRAPELVTGEIRLPNLMTDRHALAILLYRWFFFIHPLSGDRIYDPDQDKDELLRFGKQATYIEHPTDTSNRASKQTFRAPMLGKEITKLFERVFVEGLRNPRQRPRPSEWQTALYHIYDQIVPCSTPECWWHFFVAKPGEPLICPGCQQPLQQPTELPFVYLLQHRGGSNANEYLKDETRSHYLVGWPGRTLHQWHVRPDATPIYTSASGVPDLQPWASFSLDQKAANWSLKNVSRQPMYYQLPEDVAAQRWRAWAPDEHIWLVSGMQLQFGPAPFYFRALVRLEDTQKGGKI